MVVVFASPVVVAVPASPLLVLAVAFPLGATALEAAPVVPATVVVTLTVLAALRTTGRAVVPATVVAAVVATTLACINSPSKVVASAVLLLGWFPVLKGTTEDRTTYHMEILTEWDLFW
mgnify:CR=1 FL=1